MEKRRLGNSDLMITRIGFGAWALGGGEWKFGWGAQDDNESIATIHHALDLGINWIDTAAVYGLGHSEEVVGRVLKERSDKPYVFTKCERVWDDDGEISGSLKRESIRREVEDSLQRLGVDVIDLYQIHWPLPEADLEEGWQTMADLKAEGKVRYIGVSNFSVEQMRRVQTIAPITSLQPPYSLLKQDVENEILPFCAENNVGVIVYSPMGSGLLTGAMTRERIASLPENDWRHADTRFTEPRLSRNLKLADLVKTIGERHGRFAGEVAIAWTLRNPAVTGAIVGARHLGQVDEFIGASDFELSADDLRELETFIRDNP